MLGCVFEKVDKPIGNYQIKEIYKEYLDKKLSKSLLKFLKWVASYNYISLGNTLKLFLPNQKVIEESHKIFLYASKKKHIKSTSEQNKILKLLYDMEKPKNEIIKKFKDQELLLKKLIKKKIILEKKKIDQFNSKISLKKIILKKLSSQQANAYCSIKSMIIKKENKPIFIDGVTGSGKTEIYFHLIRYNILMNKQTLVLLPEIALSEQWLDRFKSSFGFYPMIWNSKVKITEKRKVWNAALKNKSGVFVGARSSLFLPYNNLGLIIIDEENDQSYKQEEGVIYNARDMAVLKCKIEKCNIILISATPSLETYQNCKSKKYRWVKIKNRFNNASYPKIKLIDMKKSKSSLISEKLVLKINKNLKEKKQSLILINRRGYAPVCICSKCGTKKNCNYCESSMVYHKENNFLMCHQCGRKETLDRFRCSKCNNEKFVLVGAGLEKVYEETRKIFSKARIIKLSSDYLENQNFIESLKKIENSEIDIIVGTQIISKGFDFENLRTVFIIDFDSWFNNADIRTNEKVFQLTQQVAGRAGRREEIGEVYIQTFEPTNKILHYIVNNQRDIYYNKELELRKKNFLPPFSRLLSITISSKESNIAYEKANKVKVFFEKSSSFQVLGPIPAQVFYINNYYRYKLLIKANKPFIIQNHMIKKKIYFKVTSKVKVKFDIDPYNLY